MVNLHLSISEPRTSTKAKGESALVDFTKLIK